MKWADILKRRPLRINTAQRKMSPEEIMAVKNKISELVTDVKIIELYVSDSESFSKDHHPKQLDRLEEALSDGDLSDNYHDQAAPITRITTDLLFSDKISLRNLLYELKSKLLDILRYRGVFLSKKDSHIVEQTIEKIRNIHHMYKEYLDEQERQWRYRG